MPGTRLVGGRVGSGVDPDAIEKTKFLSFSGIESWLLGPWQVAIPIEV
jgi:hypothetical protein